MHTVPRVWERSERLPASAPSEEKYLATFSPDSAPVPTENKSPTSVVQTSTEMALVLPPFECPSIFNISGGTRLILISGGPGQRLKAERELGKCDLSHGGVDQVNDDFAWVPQRVAQELPQFFRTPSHFAGAKQVLDPTVWHDGAPKSVWSYDIFKRTVLYKFRDSAAAGGTADHFWENGINRTDRNVVTTAILFCSLQTVYRIMLACNLITPTARIAMPSSAIAIITIPIGAPASFSMAAGPFASNVLHWGTVTEQESKAIHSGGSATDCGGGASATCAGDSEKAAATCAGDSEKTGANADAVAAATKRARPSSE